MQNSTDAARAQVEANLAAKQSILALSEAQRGAGESAREALQQQLGALEATRGAAAATAEVLARQLNGAIAQQSDNIGALREELQQLDAFIRALNGQIDEVRNRLRGAGQQGQGAGQQISQGMKQGADAAGQMAGAADRAGQAGLSLADIYKAVRSEFEQLSEGATQLFDATAAQRFKTLTGSVDDFFRALRQAQEFTRQQVEQEKILIETQIRGYENLTEARIRSMLETGRTAEGLERAAARVEQTFKLMGEEDLSRLRSALSSAAGELRRIDDASKSAKASLEALSDEFRRNALQRANDQEALAKIEFQNQLKRIKELEEQGGASARAQAEEARRLARQEHEARLAEIRAEEQERKEADRRAADDKRRQSGSNTGGSASSSPGPAGAGGQGGGLAPAASGGSNVTINIAGLPPFQLGVRSPQDADTLRQVIEQLTRAGRNSGFGGSIGR